jgi:uncharacterized membrane protein
VWYKETLKYKPKPNLDLAATRLRRWPILLAIILLTAGVIIPIANASYSIQDSTLSSGHPTPSIYVTASWFGYGDNHNEQGDFSIGVAPTSQTVLVGEKAHYAVIVTAIGGFHDRVTLALRGLPNSMMARLYPSSWQCPFNSTLEIVTYSKASPGTYTLNMTGFSEKTTHFTIVTLILVSKGNPSADFSIAGFPSFLTIDPGQNAQYTVTSTSLNGFSGNISFSLTGAPLNSTQSFNPEKVSLDGNKVASSTLSVSTDKSTAPGTYTLAITGVAEVGGVTHQTMVALILTGAKTHLSVTISTDKLSYDLGSSVSLFGNVTGPSGPVGDATVSIQVVNQQGATVHIVYLRTGNDGYYSESFPLGDDAGAGVYAVYVTASKPGYQDAYGHCTFTVGASSAPNVVITKVYTTDMGWSVKSVFQPGETLMVWVEVVNTGADLVDGIVWVQIVNPNGVPIKVDFHVGLIAGGQTVKEGFSITLPADAPQGEYRATSFVSDKMISEGGKFLTTMEGKFKVS